MKVEKAENLRLYKRGRRWFQTGSDFGWLFYFTANSRFLGAVKRI